MAVIRSQAQDPFTGRRTGPMRTRRRVEPLQLPEDPHAQLADGPMPDDIDALTSWVGYDPSRAKAALVAEHDREHIRSEVLDILSGVLTRETS